MLEDRGGVGGREGLRKNKEKKRKTHGHSQQCSDCRGEGVGEVGEVIGRVSGDANKNKQREIKSANQQNIQSS